MNKISAEINKWHRVCWPSQDRTSRLTSDHVFSGIRINRETIVRCGQFSGAVLIAVGFYLPNLWSDDGMRLLVTLSATCALLYIGLAVESRSGALALFNLLAAPILFMTAYAGMIVTEWLILSFILHGSVTAVQHSYFDNDLRGWMFCWTVFSSTLAVFLLLGQVCGN